jgi:hypothetical protein
LSSKDTRRKIKEALHLFELGALQASAATLAQAAEGENGGDPLARYAW